MGKSKNLKKERQKQIKEQIKQQKLNARKNDSDGQTSKVNAQRKAIKEQKKKKESDLKYFALTQEEWKEATDEQKLVHFQKHERQITDAIFANDSGDLGFREIDWGFIEANKSEFNLEFTDQEKLSIFSTDSVLERFEDCFELDPNDQLSEVPNDLSDQEKIKVIDLLLSTCKENFEWLSDWIIENKLSGDLGKKYNLAVGNFFYNSWFWQKYREGSDANVHQG